MKTSDELMELFDSLITRPQYSEESSLTEGDLGMSRENKMVEIDGACRVAETDSGRLQVAVNVLMVAGNMHISELNMKMEEEYRKNQPLVEVTPIFPPTDGEPN